MGAHSHIPFSLQKNLGEGRVVQKFKSHSNTTGGE
jgi:hypothetical protein